MRKVREEFLRPSRRLTLRSLREMYLGSFHAKSAKEFAKYAENFSVLSGYLT
jgi:hypothetical protein